MKNYIVLDLEWNQGSQDDELEQMPFEIIEIGAIKLDSEKKETGSFSRLIKPQVYRTMHFMNAKIVHLKMQDLDRGEDFRTALSEFMEWCGNPEDYIFCTWGDLDLTELQRNIRYFGMEPLGDGPIRYLDIQKLFSISKEDGKSRRTLEYAVDLMGLEIKDEFHRALSDAYYTAEVFRELHDSEVEKRVSFDVFHTPVDEDNEVHITFDTYSKYISRKFPDKALALRDKEVNSIKCYLCGRNAKRKVNWFSLNGKHYYCIGECSEHGLLRSKIRIRRAEDGGIYVVKTTKLISEADAAATYIKAKKARLHHTAVKKFKNQNGQIRNDSADSSF